jgi:hypothetical protein
VTEASPGVIVFTTVGVVATVYAFICHVRAERVARTAMKRVRAMHPGLWQRLDWLLRLASPAITMTVLRARHGTSDPHFDRHLQRVKRLQRRGHVALAAGFVCIALLLIGTRFWGWTW